mmetsp:Transcript_59805/g.160271  ORF Transcript_59805/g.160271 Transcript_59805/m.160271 type:complete len:632 (+) Transcript_59805:306-2201(+)
MQHEARADARLHGPILWPNRVVEAKLVPCDNVRVRDRSIGLRPPWKAFFTHRLVHELAAGEALVAGVWRDPQILVEDRHPLASLALWPGERLHGVHGLQLVGCRPAVAVLNIWVDELPEALGLIVFGANGLLLRSQDGLLQVEGIAERVAGAAHGVAHRVALQDGVRVAVHGHVELGAEHVLVDMAPDAGRHRGTKLLALRQPASGVDDAGGLHLELDGAVHHEVPVARVLVVANGVHSRDHQSASTAHLRCATHVRVLPENAVVLLVDANGIPDAPALALRGGNPGIEVGDRALAVAAKLQLVCVDAEADLAQVENVLAGVRRLRAAVRHHHLRDASAVAHGAAGVADVTEDEALAEVEADVQLPLVPVQHPVVEGEGGALRLGDHQGLEGVAPKVLLVVLRPVVHGILGHRHHEAVFDLDDGVADAVEDHVEALDRVSVVVFQVPEALPEVAQERCLAVNLLPRHAGALPDGPGLDVEGLLVHLHPTLGQCRRKFRGLGGCLPHGHGVLELDHGPGARHVLPVDDLLRGQVDVTDVSTQLGALEGCGSCHAGHRCPGLPLAHLRLVWVQELDDVKPHVEARVLLRGLCSHVDLRRRQGVQGVRHGRQLLGLGGRRGHLTRDDVNAVCGR